jgi:hypothetical protein
MFTEEVESADIDLTQASASHEFARMLSTRPWRKRRVDALSYVETNLLYNLFFNNQKSNFERIFLLISTFH